MADDEVLTERDGRLAWVTLNRPQRLNALNSRWSLGRPNCSAAKRNPRSLAGKASGSPRPRIAITSAVHGPIPGTASS